MKTLWVITKDYISDGEKNGEGNCKVDPKDLPHSFMLYDDDGELYFRGKMDTDQSEKMFEPLDWAMMFYGATEMRFQENSKGKFESV